MLSINISTLQSHYLGPFYSLNSLKISLERPKKLNRTLLKEDIMDTLRLPYKSNVLLIYRDSVEMSNLQNFIRQKIYKNCPQSRSEIVIILLFFFFYFHNTFKCFNRLKKTNANTLDSPVVTSKKE